MKFIGLTTNMPHTVFVFYAHNDSIEKIDETIRREIDSNSFQRISTIIYINQDTKYKLITANRLPQHPIKNRKATIFNHVVGTNSQHNIKNYFMGDMLLQIEPVVKIKFLDQIIADFSNIISIIPTPSNDVRMSLLKYHSKMMMNIRQVSNEFDKQQLVQAITQEIFYPEQIQNYDFFELFIMAEHKNRKHELHAARTLLKYSLSPYQRELVISKISELLIEIDKENMSQ